MIGAHFDSWHASPNASDNAPLPWRSSRPILKAVGRAAGHPVALWEERSRDLRLTSMSEPFCDPGRQIGKKTATIVSVIQPGLRSRGTAGSIFRERVRRRSLPSDEAAGDLGSRPFPSKRRLDDHVAFDQAACRVQFIQDRIAGPRPHNLDFYDTLSPET